MHITSPPKSDYKNKNRKKVMKMFRIKKLEFPQKNRFLTSPKKGIKTNVIKGK